MSKHKFSRKDLINLVIKKAEGYYYTEEVFEYEKTQNKSNSAKKHIENVENLNFFEICDRGKNDFNNPCDTIESSNEKHKNQQNTQDLTLVKKKVTTHYIPSDILAIKILFEIYGKEIENDNLENLSDSDLLNLKNKLIKEVLNDNQ